jgi:anthranilate phosphoribosyltransferase
VSEPAKRFRALLGKVAEAAPLSADEAGEAFDLMMAGEVAPVPIAAFLMALRVRGETVEEITAGARSLRARMVRIEAPPGAIDTCGTGGDGKETFNISTAAALVVAGAGVPVAKHGNRGVSSRSGSSDVLAALGVNLDADLGLVERSIREAGVGFLMAPRHHGAMRHVAPVRAELGLRTVFNLLGPLANPAGVRHQLVGVFDERWLEPLALVLGRLGAERAWVVHSEDGLDELATTAPTRVAAWDAGRVRTFVVTPEEAGLPRAKLEDLKGGGPAENALAIRSLLEGAPGALRDAAILSAAGALVVAGRAADLREGAVVAAASIDEGRAAAALERMVQITCGRA